MSHNFQKAAGAAIGLAVLFGLAVGAVALNDKIEAGKGCSAGSGFGEALQRGFSQNPKYPQYWQRGEDGCKSGYHKTR